jgi:hypothetical protein
MCTTFLLEILKGRNLSEDLGVDGRIILKWDYGWRVRIEFVWLRIGICGGLL